MLVKSLAAQSCFRPGIRFIRGFWVRGMMRACVSVTLEQSVARLGRLVMTRWLITQGRSLQQQGDDVHLSNLLKAGTIHKAKDITLGREEEESD